MRARQPGAYSAAKPTLGDYKQLLRIPSLLANIGAQTAMTFAIGGLSVWAPTYFHEERGLPLEQPGHHRLQDPRRAEQAALRHLGEAAAGRADRLHQAGAFQLLLPVVGPPPESVSGLDPVDGGVGAEGQAEQAQSSWVVTPSWAGPGWDGRIWVTPARQLGSLP